MKRSILCVILAVLMVLPLAACTPSTTEPPTDTEITSSIDTTDTEPSEESSAEQTTQEAQTEPPLELDVPAYEDIGLSSILPGIDNSVTLNYNFADYKYSKLRSDNKLVFTSNKKDYVVDKGGLTLTADGWNSVGFAHTLKEAYTAKTHITNRGAENNVRSIMFGCRVTRSNHLYIDSGLWFTFSENAVYAVVKNGFTNLIGNNFDFNAKGWGP